MVKTEQYTVDNWYTAKKHEYKFVLKGNTYESILNYIPITEIENYIRKEKLKLLIDKTE